MSVLPREAPRSHRPGNRGVGASKVAGLAKSKIGRTKPWKHINESDLLSLWERETLGPGQF